MAAAVTAFQLLLGHCGSLIAANQAQALSRQFQNRRKGLLPEQDLRLKVQHTALVSDFSCVGRADAHLQLYSRYFALLKSRCTRDE